MTVENISYQSPRKNVADLGGSRTRDLLVSSRTRIQLSHGGRLLSVSTFGRPPYDFPFTTLCCSCGDKQPWITYKNQIFIKQLLFKETSWNHAYVILTPLNPTFHIVKQEYTLFFLFLFKNLDCEYLLQSPRQGGSNKYPQSMKYEKYQCFMWKFSDFGGQIFYIFK